VLTNVNHRLSSGLDFPQQRATLLLKIRFNQKSFHFYPISSDCLSFNLPRSTISPWQQHAAEAYSLNTQAWGDSLVSGTGVAVNAADNVVSGVVPTNHSVATLPHWVGPLPDPTVAGAKLPMLANVTYITVYNSSLPSGEPNPQGARRELRSLFCCSVSRCARQPQRQPQQRSHLNFATWWVEIFR
jgi:hypothetical protein